LNRFNKALLYMLKVTFNKMFFCAAPVNEKYTLTIITRNTL